MHYSAFEELYNQSNSIRVKSFVSSSHCQFQFLSSLTEDQISVLVVHCLPELRSGLFSWVEPPDPPGLSSLGPPFLHPSLLSWGNTQTPGLASLAPPFLLSSFFPGGDPHTPWARFACASFPSYGHLIALTYAKGV
jgi:hypothetical protein